MADSYVNQNLKLGASRRVFGIIFKQLDEINHSDQIIYSMIDCGLAAEPMEWGASFGCQVRFHITSGKRLIEYIFDLIWQNNTLFRGGKVYWTFIIISSTIIAPSFPIAPLIVNGYFGPVQFFITD